jgi:hypothetical protein
MRMEGRMKAFRWVAIFSLVGLFLGCVSMPLSNQNIYLTINSEPSGARIYAEGELLGNAPLTITINMKPSTLNERVFGKSPDNSPLLIPAGPRISESGIQGPGIATQQSGSKSFTAVKEGYQSQTKIFHFSQVNWGVTNYSMLFVLEPQDARPQQQQQQQQQTTIVMPGAAGAAKAFGTLTIITTPAQAEIYIDGTFISTAPVSNIQVEAGAHKIEIQKSGYKTWSRTMQILANSPAKIEIELERI